MHDKKFLTRREACEYLGISLSTLERYVKNYDDFPLFRFGPRVVKIEQSKLDEWVKSKMGK